MHLGRAAWLGVGIFDDLAAVETDRGSEPVDPGGGEIRHGAAHAEADHRHFAARPQHVGGRRDVAYHGVPVDLAEVAARLGDLVGRIAGLEVAHEAVEHGGRHGGIAERGQAIAHRADVVVHAENFLHHHDAAERFPGGIGAVGAELVRIGGSQ